MPRYRSKLEERLHRGALQELDYEAVHLPYTATKEYTPDFVDIERKLAFEAKGYFRTSSEARKYVDVRDSNPDWTLIFVFSDPDKPLPWARRRVKDGKRMSHGDWATNNGFKFYSEASLMLKNVRKAQNV